MRALWTGSLSFGLINIPIRLYSATQDNSLNFDMLHKKDLSPIRYARICKLDGKEIPYQDIVKGYQYEKGDYVVLVEEDFNRANLKKTKLIEIVNFVEEKEIDPIFYEKPYYLEPGKGAEKAYVLLRESLKKSKKVAIGRFVFHHREHIAAIKPYENILMLDQLRFDSEIKKAVDLQIPENIKTTKQEIEMALLLIEKLTTHFHPEKYHDTYIEALQQIIKEKAKGKKPRARKNEKVKETSAKNIVQLLKKSLETHYRKTA